MESHAAATTPSPEQEDMFATLQEVMRTIHESLAQIENLSNVRSGTVEYDELYSEKGTHEGTRLEITRRVKQSTANPFANVRDKRATPTAA